MAVLQNKQNSNNTNLQTNNYFFLISCVLLLISWDSAMSFNISKGFENIYNYKTYLDTT